MPSHGLAGGDFPSQRSSRDPSERWCFSPVIGYDGDPSDATPAAPSRLATASRVLLPGMRGMASISPVRYLLHPNVAAFWGSPLWLERQEELQVWLAFRLERRTLKAYQPRPPGDNSTATPALGNASTCPFPGHTPAPMSSVCMHANFSTRWNSVILEM